MAEALRIFQDGERITAEDTNNNNRYLEELNSKSAADIKEYLENEISKLKAEISGSIIKAGTIVILPHEKSVQGYLKCDGSSVLREDYENLFNEIGTIYGAVDGYHFNVPDFQGMFLRGYGGDSATIGTKQECALPNITGSMSNIDGGGGTITASGAFSVTGQWAAHGRGQENSNHSNVNFTASRSNSVYKDVQEARPVNYAVNFWIKY